MNLSLRAARGSLIRVLLSGLCLGAAGALAACGSGTVGTGNAPQTLVIAAPAQTAPLPTLQMYECLTSGLRALLYFTNGSVGDFTSRVVWSSSNPGAVQVSNGDIAAPGGFYAHGVLVPTGPGNAVITADYFGVSSQIAISVGTPQSIKLKAIINADYVPLWRANPDRSSDSGSFSMAQATQLQTAVTAVLGNVETDISKFASFGFQVPNSAVASYSLTTPGLLIAGVEGGPVVPVASFAPCNLTSITDPNNIEQLRVVRAQSIAMQPEFPPPDPSQPISSTNPLPQLIAGNSERFPVIATLADGHTQDVSTQSAQTVTGNTGSGAAFNGNLLVTSAAGGPLVLQSTFNVGGAALTAPTISTSAVSGVLQTFSICWTDLFTQVQGNCPSSQPVATVQAGTLTPLQFHAIGYYGTDGNGNPIYQEVTRNTTWGSTNTGIATFGSGGFLAGQANGISQGSVTVQVTNSAAILIPTVFTQLNVSPPP
ncbi:MAG: hypothetical protein JOY51_00425 [Nevskia sp.]|nr:hypothetical protein [Nevskia sp.]